MRFYFDKEVDEELEKQSKTSTISTILTFGFFTSVINNILNNTFDSNIHKPVGKREYNYFIKAYRREVAKQERRLYKKEILGIATYAYRFALSRAFYYRALSEGYKYILWLRTISKHPREIHLIEVGKKVEITVARIASGRLPGLLIGCKCGAQLIKPPEQTKD